MNFSEAGKTAWIKRGDYLRHLTEIKMKERRDEYLLSPKRCKKCNIIIAFEKRLNDFCSHSCAGLFNHEQKPRKMCKKCGIKPRFSTWWYCTDCHLPMVREWNDPRNGKATFRKLLFRDRGWKCENCNNAEWMSSKIPLEVHHIDGNADNWNKENLQLLCPNCHALTPNYKFKNVNSGSSRQERRRRRYREGKTY